MGACCCKPQEKSDSNAGAVAAPSVDKRLDSECSQSSIAGDAALSAQSALSTRTTTKDQEEAGSDWLSEPDSWSEAWSDEWDAGDSEAGAPGVSQFAAREIVGVRRATTIELPLLAAKKKGWGGKLAALLQQARRRGKQAATTPGSYKQNTVFLDL